MAWLIHSFTEQLSSVSPQSASLQWFWLWRTKCSIKCLDLNSTSGLRVSELTAVLTPAQTSPLLLLLLLPLPFLPWRLLTTDPSQLREEDLPGDLQSLSWLTSVDVPRLQQMADSRGHSNGPSQGSLLEQQTGEVTVQHSKTASSLWLDKSGLLDSSGLLQI